jgi:DNA replication licensing factor MCM5
VRGIQSELNRDGINATGFAQPSITQDDEENIMKMAKDPLIYEKISKSIASAIYGHPDIKKAVACLLFGGTPKRLPDGMKLRGDINVLLLGDPSVAKSQFLKFVERVAPISVYTSGKGSSAAGLTAAVIKDQSSGDF